MAKIQLKFKRLNKAINKAWFKINKVFLIIVVLELMFPQISIANNIEASTIDYLKVEDTLFRTKQTVKLPENREREPRFTTKIIATAYNSLPSQTDNSPCITASGFDLCEHNTEDIIATNYLPMGTMIKIPELYGDRIFRVEDRMHAKYYKHIDIWLKDYNEAVKFGAKWVEIEVY